MRAVLFITALAGILAAAAAIRAVQARRYWESVFWFAAAYAVPINPEVLHLLLPNLADPLILQRFLLLLLFVGGAVLAVWAAERKARWAPAPWAAIVLIPFFLVPSYGKVANYENVETPALSELSRWAREATAKDAVFLFPDARRQVYPGVFRVRSLRNVYVDWKTGGQINFFPHLAEEWWRRWQLTMAGRFVPAHMARYASLGIDYVVVQAAHRVSGRKPLFQNSSFIVYKL